MIYHLVLVELDFLEVWWCLTETNEVRVTPTKETHHFTNIAS